ncbi:uncharacterized protein LOC126842394 isoform X2 [Adelges cooleyi]|uniref:uncharacterized protein LOC126842394 isoform X2 n=1 Tax=Adelges cooleyi TaxID=133065 RepID=UPI00217FE81C|nr:uncharacterized protein LOC126842394 isoform X2 [Adelges cooleyi]
MKLLCILITLAIVNVAPIMTADYANSVYITNKYIKEVFDRDPDALATAIYNIIYGDNTFDVISLMLAIPEKANIFSIDHDDSFIMNLPEHIAIADQVAVQEAISQVTTIPVPKLGPNQNFENDSLIQLGEERRSITGKVTKNLLIAAIGKGTPRFRNLTEICRLIGLLRSMQSPDSYIKTAIVDQDNFVCTLTSQNGRFQYIPDLYYALVRQMVPNVYESIGHVFNDIQNWFM